MDEVLELLLVLVDAVIGFVAQHAPVLDEVLESGAGVARGTKAKLASGLGCRQGASPAQQVEQLGREKGDARPADGQRGEAEPERREQRGMQLAG